MTLRQLLSLLLLPLLLACTNEGAVVDLPSVYDDVDLELNHGEKWKIPHEMAVYMDSSIWLIGKSDAAIYIAPNVPGDLTRQKDGFVSHCGMDGAGHDELHKWLLPYIDLLERLEAAQTEEEQWRVFPDIVRAKHLYEYYFE